MLMTNGLGASIGTWAAGKVVNGFVYNPQAAGEAGNWPAAWYVFALYALVVAVSFIFLFKNPQPKEENAA